MKPLRGYVLRVERTCLCHPRRRGVLPPDGLCPLCGGEVSESMDELRRQTQGRPIEVSWR